jgi:AraC-like DNA-binding protein
MDLNIQSALPDPSISPFVHSFWMLENYTGKDINSIVLPNGMVDLTWMKTDSSGWSVFLRGIDTHPSHVIIKNGIRIFTIGLKLLAVEYILSRPIKDLLNRGLDISQDSWQIADRDMESFEKFCQKATKKIKSLPTVQIDDRKKKLLDLVYSSNGSMQVKELSDRAFWSSRQINRYFNQQFGLSLKTYCNLLRLGSSFKHISEGRLFPEQNFTDQNHFIKEIKKYAGVTPKELSKNKDDSFIDITAIKNFPC